MAVISFNSNKEWSSARWVFENLLEKVEARLSEGDDLKLVIAASLRDGSHFLDASKLSDQQLQEFDAQLKAVIVDVEARGQSNFSSPEFYTAFLSKARELVGVLNAT